MSLGGSSPAPQPVTQTTTRQVPEYAPEQREYVRDIFGKAQELYEQRTAEGFQPFPGASLAGFAPEEQEAFTGISGLARGPGALPAFETARTAALGSAAPITSGDVTRLMSPYQQAVTDIAKREAARSYARGPAQQIRTGAVEAGGLRGARRAIEEAEGQRNLAQLMSDIQVTGSQQAYDRAMAEAAAERGRLAGLAQLMPSIGTGAYQQQLAQYGQLGGVGEARRGMEQAGIDLARSQFQQELMFPEETLATYLRFITNAPSPSGFQQTTLAPAPRGPSAITQLGGLAGGLGTLAGGLGRLSFKQGGRIPGLSGIVRRNEGGRIVRMADGGLFGERSRRNLEASVPNYGESTVWNPVLPVPLPKPVVEPTPEPVPVKTETPTPEVTTPVAPPEDKGEMSLDEFRKMMSDVEVEDKDLSWPERLQMAAAFFEAAGSPSTGTLLGDLSQLGAKASAGAAPALASRAAREKAAADEEKALRRAYAAYQKGVREEGRAERLLNLKEFETLLKAQSDRTLKDVDATDIGAARTYLERVSDQGGLDFKQGRLKLPKERRGTEGEYSTVSVSRSLAQIAKTYDLSGPAEAFELAKNAGAVYGDADNNLVIDINKFRQFYSGSGRSSKPSIGTERDESGEIVVRKEGGPVLRYPEDFT